MVRVTGKGLRVTGLVLGIFFYVTRYPLPVTLCYADSTQSSAAKVEKLFLMEKYENTVSEADRLIDANASRRDELYYLRGLAQIKLKRYGFARESFEYILSTYSDSKLAFDAYTGIGDAYYLEGNTHSAARVYGEITDRFPRDKNISIIRRRLEDCGKRLGADYSDKPGRPEAAAISAGPGPLPVAAGGGFSIQVGGFKEKRNAYNLARKLAAKGYDSYVDPPAASAGDNLYRVKVGRLGSNEDARKLAARLKVSGYPARICADDPCR